MSDHKSVLNRFQQNADGEVKVCPVQDMLKKSAKEFDDPKKDFADCRKRLEKMIANAEKNPKNSKKRKKQLAELKKDLASAEIDRVDIPLLIEKPTGIS